MQVALVLLTNKCRKIGDNYKAFHRFGQAKFLDGGSVFGLSQFSILPENTRMSVICIVYCRLQMT